MQSVERKVFDHISSKQRESKLEISVQTGYEIRDVINLYTSHVDEEIKDEIIDIVETIIKRDFSIIN